MLYGKADRQVVDLRLAIGERIQIASEPLARLHQAQIHQLLTVPLKWGRIVPVKRCDVEHRPGIGAQGLGRPKADNGGSNVVMPWAGIGIILFVAKSEVSP